jgi:hypothetical protein
MGSGPFAHAKPFVFLPSPQLTNDLEFERMRRSRSLARRQRAPQRRDPMLINAPARALAAMTISGMARIA